MKRLYSIILLVSFLIGALQPILPMIQYQLHEGSIIELMVYQAEDAGTNCMVTPDNADKEGAKKANDPQNLLNGDYYPLALQIATIPKPVVFPHKFSLYLPEINDISSPCFIPIPPPPKMA